ncbi:MAG: hypothetical protein AB7T06_33900 [Kofleriaceae bacterium]
MPSIAFPRRTVVSLQDLATRVLEKYPVDADLQAIARDLLEGFADICLLAGLDRTLAEIEAGLDEDHGLQQALVDKLSVKANFDPRGPRNAKAGQLTECLIAVVGLTPSDTEDRTLTLPHGLRVEVHAALATTIERVLGVPQIRAAIVEKARARCEERHLPAFEKIAARLDDRGMKLMEQPKVPLEASQAIQHHLQEARAEVIGGAARDALDRALQVLANANPEAAARMDESVSDTATVRDVAIRRVLDPRVEKLPASVVRSLMQSIGELAQLAWAQEEVAARPYAASQTFAVGETVDHPKFGRGSVVAVTGQRMDVEFPDGKFTLVHARK